MKNMNKGFGMNKTQQQNRDIKAFQGGISGCGKQDFVEVRDLERISSPAPSGRECVISFPRTKRRK